MKIKDLLPRVCLLISSSLTVVSCNDFLDREPLASVTPQEYFQTVDHFASYAISHYQGLKKENLFRFLLYLKNKQIKSRKATAYHTSGNLSQI